MTGWPLPWTSIAFAWPWMAALLPLPWLLFRAWPALVGAAGQSDRLSLGGEEASLLHARLDTVQAAFGGHALPAGVGRWRHWLFALLWAALILALMRPLWLAPHSEVTQPGHDLLLAVDASHSMDALDFAADGRQVSRMAVVKHVLGQFIDARAGDRLGLIVFGNAAHTMAPLTVDRAAVRQALDGLLPSIVGPSTALGDAIALGVRTLRERPAGSRVLVLIADGDNTAGQFQPLEAAAAAAAFGVRIYVIGVGSTQTRIPILHRGQIEYWDDLTMDEELLARIAAIADGAYFRATDTDALRAISARINALETTVSETRQILLPHPLYRWPLLLALLALLGLGVAGRDGLPFGMGSRHD